jgi:hypothetical protein
MGMEWNRNGNVTEKKLKSQLRTGVDTIGKELPSVKGHVALTHENKKKKGEQTATRTNEKEEEKKERIEKLE